MSLKRVSAFYARRARRRSSLAHRLARAMWGKPTDAPVVFGAMENLESRQLLAADVIISEIMYHPSSEDPLEEYIELHNKGDQAANLAGWRFERGVDFTFTGGTLAPGAYLVVAADVARFMARYPTVSNVVGGWTGSLANDSEGIELVNAAGSRVDEVEYADSGDWARRVRDNWPELEVQSLTRSGSTATAVVPRHGYDFGDTVRISGATEDAWNGDFVVTAITVNSFTFNIGTNPPSPASGEVLSQRINDHGHIGWTWEQLADGGGRSLEVANLNVTNNQGQNWASSFATNGTPGRSNSINSTNIAPVIANVTQFPAIPTSNQKVTISARIIDEATPQLVTLRWRPDGGTLFNSVSMRDDGTGGDAVAGDGVYSGQIDERSHGSIVEYFITASDGTRTRNYPNTADQQSGGANLLYQVDDNPIASGLPTYRIIMRAADQAELNDIGQGPDDPAGSFERNSNASFNATFIVLEGGEVEVIHQVGVRNRGHGSRTAQPNNRHVEFPSDDRFHDATAVNFNIATVRSQVIGSVLYRLAGFAAPDTAAATLVFNGQPATYAIVEEKNSDFTDNHFPEDPNGNLYSAFRLDPNLFPEGELRFEGTNPDAYRDRYFKESNREADDWSDLIELTNVLNNAPAAGYLEAVGEVMDIDYWLRYIAFDALMNNNETGLNSGIGDDYYMYRGVNDPRFLPVPHDLDSIMGQNGGNINRSIFSVVVGNGQPGGSANGVDGLKRLFNEPEIVKKYYATFIDIITNFFNPQNLNPIIDYVLTPFATQAQISSIKQFVINRTNAVLSQIPREFRVDVGLPLDGSGYYRTSNRGISLSGVANVATTGSVLVDGQVVTLNALTGAWATSGSSGGGSQTLIRPGFSGNPGSLWRYLDTGVDAGTAWREPDFDDSGWLEGAGQLGYGDGDENTPVAFIDTQPGTPGIQRNATTYFRHKFKIPAGDVAQYSSATLRIVRDDGASIFVNGVEVYRSNLPGVLGDDLVKFDTPADVSISAPEENTFMTVDVPLGLLHDGENTIAVEVHNAGNADMSFNLELIANKPSVGGLPLRPGINRVNVQAFAGPNGTGEMVNSQFVDIWYDGAGLGGTGVTAPAADVSSVGLLTPATYRPGNPVLIEVSALDAAGEYQRELWDGVATLSTNTPGVTLSTNQVKLYNGRGSVLAFLNGATNQDVNITATLSGKSETRTLLSRVNETVTNVSGTLPGTASTWSGVVRVTGDVTVPAGHTLTIQPGTLVLVNGVASGSGGVDILVNGGRIISNGTASQPVTFTSFDGNTFWGEVRFTNAQASTFNYTLFHKGGASPGVGHTGTGPTIRTSGSNVTFDHVSITDSLGKSGHSTSGSSLTFRDSLMGRGRMGFEIDSTSLEMGDTWIIDMAGPDDADGIYLHGQQTGTILIHDSVVAQFGDDGIDTLRADVLLNNVIVRDGNDKGISVFGGEVTLTNGLIINNAKQSEDGPGAQISAKENAPDGAIVRIDHTTISGGGIGIQVQEKSNASEGIIEYFITNSIIRTVDAVSVDAPHDANLVRISYSNLNEAWPGTGNINADPLFADLANNRFRLSPGSPSANTGNPTSPNDPDGTRADQGFFRNALAGTALPKTIGAGTLAAGNYFLYPEQGPYTVTGDVNFPAGATLYVFPGTTVFFNTGTGFNFNGGRLVAEGTEHDTIRFTRTPTSSANASWDGLQFVNSNVDNRIKYAVLEWGTQSADPGIGNISGMLGLTNSTMTVENSYFDKTNRRRVRVERSSLIVRNSVFTANYANPVVGQVVNNFAEHIWGSGPANGVFLIEGNDFGHTFGHNDALDVDSVKGETMLVVRNNIFRGGGDDAMDMTADVLIEGNTFYSYRKDAYNPDPGNGNSLSLSGVPSTRTYNVVRNTFIDSPHVAIVKEGALINFINNTVIGMDNAALYFDLPGQTSGPGAGAYLDGNIFWDTPVIFGALESNPQITVNRSIVPASELGRGVGNIAADPRFFNADPANFDPRLRPGSPAIGAGPRGIDMGSQVDAGAFIAGGPRQLTGRTDANFIIGGPAITHYKFKLDNGTYGAEIPIGTPIALSGLPNGAHTISVIGKNIAGVWETDAEADTYAWTVDTTRNVVINEVLAANTGAYTLGGQNSDVIELYNDGMSAVNLRGMSISDNPGNPRKFTFNADVIIQPGQYLILVADNGSAPGAIHIGSNMSLRQNGEGVFLYDASTTPVLKDSVEFGLQLDNLSIGRLADGSWALNQPTIGAANALQRTGDVSTLRINEFLAEDTEEDDFIELYNPDTLPVHLGGLFITDHTQRLKDKHEIADLSFIRGSGFAVFVADDQEGDGPEHLNFNLDAFQESIGLYGPALEKIDEIIYNPQRLTDSQGRQPDGTDTWRYFDEPNPGLPNPNDIISTLPLRVTELNYNPTGSMTPGLSANDYEYIELKNIGATPLNLNGVKFAGGVEFVFPNISLAPGELILVVKNQAAFEARYGTGFRIAGQYTDSLDDNGELIRLLDNADGTIQSFIYSDAWYPITDGGGHTLVIKDPFANENTWNLSTSWMPSSFTLGSPGDESTGTAGTLIINEVLANTAGNDFIELRNTTNAAIPIGGWYLSDSADSLLKFRIPDGTSVPANGYLALSETVFGAAFDLDHNEDVYLSQSFVPNVLVGYRVTQDLDASEAEVSSGLHTRSTGDAVFVPMANPTPGQPNSVPKVGPIVISEIMYNPVSGDEFIELRNISAQTVNLHDGAGNAWQFTAGIDFTFPNGVSVGPNGQILLVQIEPEVFRQRYNVHPSVQIFQYVNSQLDDGGEPLELSKPIPAVAGNPLAPYVVVDAVTYEDGFPWPEEADANGASLERVSNTSFGDDVVNWKAGLNGGTPGQVAGTVLINGTDGADNYHIRRNGANIEVFLNVLPGAGAPIQVLPAASLFDLTIDAKGGNDTLTLHLAAGQVIPDGGLTFDGGDGDDVLTISGDAAASTGVLRFAAGAGQNELFATGGTTRLEATATGGQLDFESSSNAVVELMASHRFNEASIRDQSKVTLPAGRKVFRAASLAMDAEASLDLNDGGMILSTGSLEALKILLNRGRNALPGGVGNGKWDGKGISSSAAASQGGGSERFAVGYALNGQIPVGKFTNFLGESVSDSDILVRFTRNADANLDGVVNNNDITILAGSYRPGTPGKHWHTADFNFDGESNNNDITILAGNYRPSDPPVAPAAAAQPQDGQNVQSLPENEMVVKPADPSGLKSEVNEVLNADDGQVI